MGDVSGQAALPDVAGLVNGPKSGLLAGMVSHLHAGHYVLTYVNDALMAMYNERRKNLEVDDDEKL